MGLPVPRAPLSPEERRAAAYGKTFSSDGRVRIYHEEFRSGAPLLPPLSERLVAMAPGEDLYDRLSGGLRGAIAACLTRSGVEFTAILAREQILESSRNGREFERFIVVSATKGDDDDSWYRGIDRILEVLKGWEISDVNVELVDKRAFRETLYHIIDDSDRANRDWETLKPKVVNALSDPAVPVKWTEVDIVHKQLPAVSHELKPTIVIYIDDQAPPVSHSYVKRTVLEVCRMAGFPYFGVDIYHGPEITSEETL